MRRVAWPGRSPPETPSEDGHHPKGSPMKSFIILFAITIAGCHSVNTSSIPANVSAATDRLVTVADTANTTLDLRILMEFEKPEEGDGKYLSDGSYSKRYHFRKLGITWLTRKDSQGNVGSTFYREP
jgi:hypothetical protein